MNESPRIAATRSAYDAVAADYARLLRDMGYEAPIDLSTIEHFIAELPVGARILDAGCGAGRMLTHLATLGSGLNLAGVDLSPGMIDEARSKHPDLLLRVGDISSMPFANCDFDGIVSWYSIIHLEPENLPCVFSEFARVLRPGGLALVAFQCGSGSRTIHRAYGQDVTLEAVLHSFADVSAALVAAGLEIKTRLERGPRQSERHTQGFVVARVPLRVKRGADLREAAIRVAQSK